jgi:hypothetical protein
VASTRRYNIIDDFGFADFLGVHHIRVDGYTVLPIPDGLRGLDLKNNHTSSIVKGYVYAPGPTGVSGLPLGDIYFEPVPADAYVIIMVYAYTPRTLNLDANTTCELSDEYAPMVEILATALCFPPGSSRRSAGLQEYEMYVQKYGYDLERASEPLDIYNGSWT